MALFEGELPSATQPVPRIASQANLNLARDFLPRPPKPIVQVVYGALSQPQPDTAIGYLTPTEANASTPPLATAFSQDEQLILTNFTLNPTLHFPFLTCQWKPATGEPHQIAMLQSARDGAAIVNYLHTYYETAYRRPATTVEALHVSVTCNVELVNVWLHWREHAHGEDTPMHYMKSLHSCTTWDATPLLTARAVLKNWVAYALDQRLNSLKDALPQFYQEYWKEAKPKTKQSRSNNAYS
jgi:hypothetical protein